MSETIKCQFCAKQFPAGSQQGNCSLCRRHCTRFPCDSARYGIAVKQKPGPVGRKSGNIENYKK